MKKLGLLFLVVVMALGVAGCSKGDNDADPVGTWLVSSDTNCNGSITGWVSHIFENGTFIDTDGARGTWTVDGDSLTLNYSNVLYIYAGEIDGDRVTGTFTGPYSGCWTAVRTSTTP